MDSNWNYIITYYTDDNMDSMAKEINSVCMSSSFFE